MAAGFRVALLPQRPTKLSEGAERRSPPCRGSLTNAYQPYRSTRPDPGKPTLPVSPPQANLQPTRSTRRHAYQPPTSPLTHTYTNTHSSHLHLFFKPNHHQACQPYSITCHFMVINRLSLEQKLHACQPRLKID